jgi:uncharacterized protein (TIGR00106 family)
MALLEISIVPVGTKQPSFSSVVADACREAQRNGISYQITPTATVMEGDVAALLDVAKKMHETAFQVGAQRVVTNLTIDERRDKLQPLSEAVSEVNEAL